MHALVLSTSLGGLAALLVTAAWGDLRRFTIPNWLNAAIAGLAIAYWWGAQFTLADIGVQIALALVAFLIFAGAFAVGVMGGGDVKMIAALALWLRPGELLTMLVVMSLAGGVLTLVLLGRHRLLRREGLPEIPYGVAISVAAILSFTFFYEPILNQYA
jgi:prepilin peptidase CpaA